MSDGIYLVRYAGHTGFGCACFAFIKGSISGVDVAGSEYRGTYAIAGNQLNAQLTFTVPAGVALVTGAPPSNTPYDVPISVAVPANLNEQQTVQILVNTPTGPVSANVTKTKSLG